MGGQKILFSDFGYFKGLTGPYGIVSRGNANIMIDEVNSYHNICNKSGFTIWLCK